MDWDAWLRERERCEREEGEGQVIAKTDGIYACMAGDLTALLFATRSMVDVLDGVLAVCG